MKKVTFLFKIIMDFSTKRTTTKSNHLSQKKHKSYKKCLLHCQCSPPSKLAPVRHAQNPFSNSSMVPCCVCTVYFPCMLSVLGKGIFPLLHFSIVLQLISHEHTKERTGLLLFFPLFFLWILLCTRFKF